MDIGDGFPISPTPLKGIHKDSLKIREIFRDVKMEIYISGKTPKINRCKNVSQFTQQLQDIYFK